MKKIFISAVLVFSSVICLAQTNRVSKFEGGIYGGLTSPLGSFHDGDSEVGGMIGADLRYNINGGPWDCGAFLEIGSAMRDFNKDGGNYYQNNRTSVFGVVGHYNFRQGTNVNPYAGLGLGIALNDVVGLRKYPSKEYSLAVSPRIGVELLRHIRVGCQAELTRRGFHSVGLTLGFAIGGGKKG